MAFLAAAGAALGPLKAIGAAASAVSAIGQIQAGKAREQALEQQGKQAELRGKQQALQYRQQGVQILRNTRQNISTVTARAAAGGINPYSGTPVSLKQYARATGAEESYLARENAVLARVSGEINRQQYNSAASQARRQGYMNAIGTVGTAAATLGSIGGPGAGATQAGTGATASQMTNMTFLGG
jgi:hypothetical protein